MAVIGTWGDTVFSVSRGQVRNFQNMKRKFGARYTDHDRHLRKPLPEYKGPDLESVSFDMIVSAFLGVNPQRAIDDLKRKVEDGRIDRLIIGGVQYGSYKWICTSASVALERIDNRGNVLAAKISITLKEYPKE